MSALFLNIVITICQETVNTNQNKINLLREICGVLLKITIINKEKLVELIPQLHQSAGTMQKRNDQCFEMLYLSDLYYVLFDEKKKVLDCLKKTKRYADFSMTNASNMKLFIIIILNKAIYFIEKGMKGIVSLIEDVVETVNKECSERRRFPSCNRGIL